MKSINRWATLLSTAVLSMGMVGCGQLGPLLSVPEVSDAQTNDVVFVGDSIFALSGEIQAQIEENAQTTFRNYAISGAQLVEGSIADSVPDQLDKAFSDDPNIRLAVVDAGGNDILIPAIALDPNQCKTRWYRKDLSQKCKDLIDNLYVQGVDLMNSTADRGVDKAYLMGYYYVKDAFFKLDALEQAVDYGAEAFSNVCANSTADCTFVDTRSFINDEDIKWDGIHPKTSGSIKIGNAIWEAGLKDDL